VGFFNPTPLKKWMGQTKKKKGNTNREKGNRKRAKRPTTLSTRMMDNKSNPLGIIKDKKKHN